LSCEEDNLERVIMEEQCECHCARGGGQLVPVNTIAPLR
jgi:hypothetical protein